jgi:hypothetical protein
MTERKLGRIEVVDERDKQFPVSTVLEGITAPPDIKRRFWFDNGWWGNQGATSECVAYSWMAYLEDGPVLQDQLQEDRRMPFYDTTEFYNLCQQHDQWPGENYDGTSVRAGAKILHHLGIINSYRWAFSVNDVIMCLKFIGPVVVGTRWYWDMFTPSPAGLVEPTGQPAGGHAYILNGYDAELDVFRIKNSWGKEWGKNGHAYIRTSDFGKLLRNGGEACIAFENKMEYIPNLLLG